MKYAHKFHIVFMIFLFRLSFCSFLFFPPPLLPAFLHLFWHSFSFSALHFYWFPNGFWRLPTHTHISLGIGYSVLQVLKLELGNGVRSTYLSPPWNLICLIAPSACCLFTDLWWMHFISAMKKKKWKMKKKQQQMMEKNIKPSHFIALSLIERSIRKSGG